MPKIDYFVPVDAELQTIWSVLLDRIERPESYMAGVETCDFPENGDDFAVREVTIGGMPLKERITIDEKQGEVRYELIDHPLFKGDVYNALIPADTKQAKAKHVVQFRMNWQALNDEAKAIEAESADLLKESLEQAVHYVRDMAERLEEQQREQANETQQ